MSTVITSTQHPRWSDVLEPDVARGSSAKQPLAQVSLPVQKKNASWPRRAMGAMGNYVLTVAQLLNQARLHELKNSGCYW